MARCGQFEDMAGVMVERSLWVRIVGELKSREHDDDDDDAGNIARSGGG